MYSIGIRIKLVITGSTSQTVNTSTGGTASAAGERWLAHTQHAWHCIHTVQVHTGYSYLVINAQDPSEAWSSYVCIQLTPAYPLLLVNTVPTDKLVLYIKCLSDALQHLLTPTVVWGVVCCQAPLAGGLHDCTSEKEGKNLHVCTQQQLSAWSVEWLVNSTYVACTYTANV